MKKKWLLTVGIAAISFACGSVPALAAGNNASTVTQSGNKQAATVSQNGSNDGSTVTQSGAGNTAKSTQKGILGGTSDIEQSDSGNQATLTQGDDGNGFNQAAAGKYTNSKIVQSGQNNVATVDQLNQSVDDVTNSTVK